jgi:hypothetical protein
VQGINTINQCGPKYPLDRDADLNLFLMVVILFRGRWSKGAFPHLRVDKYVRMSKEQVSL